MRSHRVVLGALVGVAAIVGFGAVGPAAAELEGPCTASLNGVDAATRSSSDPDDAVEVDEGDTVDVVVQSSGTIARYRVQLSFAGFRWTVAEDEPSGTSWSRSVEVNDYSRFGVGLYRVHAVSEGATQCEGAMLVRVGGSPFATVAGWAALGLTGLGVGATAMAFGRPSGRIPAGSMVLGGLGGLGAVALAQQFAVAYPTRTVALIGIAAGVAAPLVASLVGGGAAAPQPAVPPAHQPAAAPPGAWVPDVVVPADGLASWSGPDTAAEASQALDAGVEVRLLDRVGDRVLVECSNGWTTWVDANALEGASRP